ncbi:8317_t:CDS:2 [Entrophospora sp. SA101]|nr:8317_t:CDS:2 [Entrophospora sp. SA101]
MLGFERNLQESREEDRVRDKDRKQRDSRYISVTSDTPLRITELTEENEKVPDLPSNLVVINKNTGQGNKNKGLLSDEALDKLIKVANGILEEHQNYNIKIPFVPSLTEAKVVHDGLVHSFPSALLVEGDVIEMIYGDIAPCRIKVISQDLSSDLNNKEQDNKERDIPSQTVWEQHLKNKGRYQFVLLETPWANCLRASIQQKRPPQEKNLWCVHTNDDNCQLIVKFAQQYNAEAHQLCAEYGFAPQLLYYNKDEIYGWHIIVSMEIHSALQKLYEKKLMFSDLCKSNIMIQEGIIGVQHVKLVNFDWCGIEGQDCYPAFINHEINWPSGVSDKKPLHWSHDKCFFNMLCDEFDMGHLKFHW